MYPQDEICDSVTKMPLLEQSWRPEIYRAKSCLQKMLSQLVLFSYKNFGINHQVIYRSSSFFASSRKGCYGVIMLTNHFISPLFFVVILSFLAKQFLKKRCTKIFLIQSLVRNNFSLHFTLKNIDSKLKLG